MPARGELAAPRPQPLTAPAPCAAGVNAPMQPQPPSSKMPKPPSSKKPSSSGSGGKKENVRPQYHGLATQEGSATARPSSKYRRAKASAGGSHSARAATRALPVPTAHARALNVCRAIFAPRAETSRAKQGGGETGGSNVAGADSRAVCACAQGNTIRSCRSTPPNTRCPSHHRTRSRCTRASCPTTSCRRCWTTRRSTTSGRAGRRSGTRASTSPTTATTTSAATTRWSCTTTSATGTR